MTTQDTSTEKCRPARTEITTNSSSKHNSESQSDVPNLQLLNIFCEPVELLHFAACDDNPTHPAAELDERFTTGRDARFSPDIAKDYVATLTDRSVQRRLRPRYKSVIYQSGTGQRMAKTLLCESDDLWSDSAVFVTSRLLTTGESSRTTIQSKL